MHRQVACIPAACGAALVVEESCAHFSWRRTGWEDAALVIYPGMLLHVRLYSSGSLTSVQWWSLLGRANHNRQHHTRGWLTASLQVVFPQLDATGQRVPQGIFGGGGSFTSGSGSDQSQSLRLASMPIRLLQQPGSSLVAAQQQAPYQQPGPYQQVSVCGMCSQAAQTARLDTA